MKLSKNDLKQIADKAIEAVKKSAAFIQTIKISDLKPYKKKNQNSLASQVVTEVDLQCQKIITDTFAEIKRKYDLGILTEESDDDRSRFEKDFFLCIDPLDGTLPFVQGKPGAAVSISLVSKNGSSIIGVVYDLTTHNIYHAIKGQGVFKNGNVYRFSNVNFKDMSLTWLFEEYFHKLKSYQDFHNQLKLCVENKKIKSLTALPCGGAVMNSIWVLENHPSIFLKFPKTKKGSGCLWDYAATVCIFKELGLTVSDIDGRDLDLNKKDFYFNDTGIVYSSFSLDLLDLKLK